MGRQQHPLGAVERNPLILVLLKLHGAGVQRHPDPEPAHGFGPGVRGQGTLARDGARQRLGGAGEGDHEGITHLLHFVTAMRRE